MYDDNDDDATNEAIMHCNRKLEELRWQDESKSDEIPETSKSLMDDFTGQQIEFAEINLGKRIGKGGFGDVYFASWKGEVVAVKRLRTKSVSTENLRGFTDEVFKFCDLDHPNIVRFVGACVKTPNLAIVMEYMRMSLFDALHVENDSVDFSEAEQLSIFCQTTSGLLYLHERNMAHCDLKTQNVLLNYAQPPDGVVTVKITDFGLSLIKSLRDEEFVRNVGTPRYSAPEVLRGEILSADGMMKADVYSLGLVIYEVIFEEEPFYNFTYDQLQKQVGEAGVTPSIPDCMSIDWKLEQLMKSSWGFDPSRRPEVKELLETFEKTEQIYSQE
ncbi:MAG: protein kinase [Candidatus Thiodiazotropha sp.]